MSKQFDPNALLFCSNYREEDGRLVLIGTDPALSDRSKYFRWVDEPGGWERRAAWPAGITNAESAHNAAGVQSGWPGAIPLRGKPGRPAKELAADDRSVHVSTLLRRAELFDIQRRASDAKQSVSEWISTTIRAELGREK